MPQLKVFSIATLDFVFSKRIKCTYCFCLFCFFHHILFVPCFSPPVFHPAITRVGGNKKGIFTRERQPKASAHHLRARYRALAAADSGAPPPDVPYYVSDSKPLLRSDL